MCAHVHHWQVASAWLTSGTFGTDIDAEKFCVTASSSSQQSVAKDTDIGGLAMQAMADVQEAVQLIGWALKQCFMRGEDEPMNTCAALLHCQLNQSWWKAVGREKHGKSKPAGCEKLSLTSPHHITLEVIEKV